MSCHGDDSLLRIDVLHAEKLLDLALDLTLSGGTGCQALAALLVVRLPAAPLLVEVLLGPFACCIVPPRAYTEVVKSRILTGQAVHCLLDQHRRRVFLFLTRPLGHHQG